MGGIVNTALDVGRFIATGPIGFVAHKLGAPDVGDLISGGPDAPAAAKIAAPPPPPDLTDEAVRQARLAARRRVLIGQGMGGTFLSGPLGDGSAPPTRAPNLSGY